MRADYHVHTEFSDDSEYPLEQVCADACRLGLDELVITDHVDYGIKPDISPLDEAGTLFDDSYIDDPTKIPVAAYGGRPTNVDYQHYFPAIRAARERWATPAHDWWAGSVMVKCGLELGVQRHTIQKNQRLVDAHRDELDYVLLSCHQVDDLEFWSGDFQRGRTPAQVTQAYYEEILACAAAMGPAGGYSCLAHLDAIRRDNKDDQRPFEAYRDIVAAILEQAIADGCGIELNTSSVRYDVPDWQPSREILALYHDLGGTIITVGSDSHKPEHLGSYITQAYDLLKCLGFEGITTFDHMQPCLQRF